MRLSSSLKRRLSLGCLTALLIGLFFFVMMRSGPLAPIQVTVAQAKEGSFAPQLFGIGTLKGRRNWMIGPTVAGRVLSVKVDVGDVVKAGQLLAEMDPDVRRGWRRTFVWNDVQTYICNIDPHH